MAEPAQWRRAQVADADAIAAIARELLSEWAEDARVYARRITLSPDGCHVLTMADRIVGHCISHPWPRGAAPALHAMPDTLPAGSDGWYLHDVAILPVARGQRAVERIVASLVAVAGARPLTLVAVGGAPRYWQRLGFVAMPAAASGYGADAVYMERPAVVATD